MDIPTKKILQIVVGVLVLITLGFLTWKFLIVKDNAVVTQTTNKKKVKEHTEADRKIAVEKVVATISKDNIPSLSEFYSDKFSESFKDAYLLYRKGVSTYGLGVDGDQAKNYLSQALISFAKLQTKVGITDEEKSFSIDVINAMYINTSWNDSIMANSVYTISPFKEMYEKNRTELAQKYPFLATSKDNGNANTAQTALDGAASQLTMGQMNDMGYKLFPHGYPVLRSKMNHLSAYQRVYSLDPQNAKIASIDQFKANYSALYTKKETLAFENELAELDKKDLLYLRMRGSAYEINLMKATVLYDPLIMYSTSNSEKVSYHKKVYEEYKKAVDLLGQLAQDPSRANLYVMVTLFYNAFMVDYGFIKHTNNYLDTKTVERYKGDSLAVTRSLMQDDAKQQAFKNYLLKGREYSKKPSNMATTTEYYGGRPYYQLRVQAEQKGSEDIKNYLIKNGGWEF